MTILVFLVLLFFPSLSLAVPIVDNASAVDANTVYTIGVTHTATITADGLLLAAVHYYVGPTVIVADCDWGGTPLTSVGTIQDGSTGGNISLWKLVSPATGSHTLTCNLNSTVIYAILGVTTFNGAGVLGTVVTTSDATTGYYDSTLDVTGASGGMVVDYITANTFNDLLPDGSQTVIYLGDVDASGSRWLHSGSSYKTGAGTQTMYWTWPSDAVSSGHLGILINPVIAAPSVVRRGVVGVIQ